MKFPQFTFPFLFRIFAALLFSFICLAPSTSTPAATAAVVVVEDPPLSPAYTTCPETYWYPFTNNRSHTAYLTLNTDNPAHSTNYAEWRPLIPEAGYYRVEAYIADHDPITWCTGKEPTIEHDTAEARYYIHHAYGVSERQASQYPLSNAWLDLGEYYFNAGDTGYISLTDINAEKEYTTTISFSAMRFTFTRPSRPQIYLPMVHYTDPGVQPPPNAGVIQAQGFDSCYLPTISQMQTWWDHSPYGFYALYLGGVHLPVMCATASSAWVSSVHQQGWSFVPTWVGLQAPCSSYKYKMSSDPAISYQQGRQEAYLASQKAASMGLTNYGLGGTVIYYDLEPYGVSTLECRQPVQAFMNGWVERLDELGNLAGGYGSRNSYPFDWANITHVPDDVWPASWYASGYDPYASVNGISWLEGLWVNHQRIRQYAGEVNNTWGGVTLNIDIDVADGMVAMPPEELSSMPVITPTASIQDMGWLSAQQGWVVRENHLYWTDSRGQTWQDISPADVQLAYFLPEEQAWAVSAPASDFIQLYHSINGGSTWENSAVHLPDGGWWPLQMGFTLPTQGWLVLQKMSSQALSTSMLMKTLDGGLTWQSYDLPTVGNISFTSSREAQLSNGNETYQSLDGGVTWQTAQPELLLISPTNLPEGATLSGWQSSSLGWAATSDGDCTGEKSSPGFSCQLTSSLWQSQDGGASWENLPMPGNNTLQP
jgi:photosystem II stability/assembly factor-like uncharacterized protein